MNLNILHITDLHISTPHENLDEQLREGNYIPFLNKFTKTIIEEIGESVDVMVTTGDYINQANTKNFHHCEKIINHIAEKLNINNENIYTCIGNHDFDKEVAKGDLLLSREPYLQFQEKYNNSKLLDAGEIHKLYFEEKQNYYVLSLESVFNKDGDNIPCNLSTGTRDKLYKTVEKNVPLDAPLIVLSHYPMDQPSSNTWDFEEIGWTNNHVWKDAEPVLKKINLLRDNSVTLYFFGDGHLPDFWSYSDKHHAFMTGKFGGNHIPKKQQLNGKTDLIRNIIQSRFVSFKRTDKPIITLNYNDVGYKYGREVGGEWQVVPSGLRLRAYKPKNEKNDELRKSDDYEEYKKNAVLTRKYPDKITKVISKSIQKEIISEIEKNKLYSFGRHKTSTKYTSLGWVDIDSLMNKRKIFSRCIEKANDWIKENIKEGDKDKTLILGLDYWGACLSANVSVMSDIHNFCISIKSEGRYNIKEETLQSLMSDYKNMKNFILFSDVISTGYSIKYVSDYLKDGYDEAVNIYSLSVISDTKQDRSVQLNNILQVATFCSTLRIPIVENEYLPQENILPMSIDIS